MGSQPQKKGRNYLHTVKQGKDELLNEYLNRFNDSMLKTQGCTQEEIVMAVQDKLQPGKILWSISKKLLVIY